MIRTLVADDHAVVRHGLIHIIEDTLDIQVVAEAETGQEVIDLVQKHQLEVVVLDLNLPDMSGLDVLKQIKTMKPTLPVLVLSMFGEKQYGVRVMRAGASGYLTKDAASYDLVKAVRKVAGGGRYLTPDLADALLSLLDGDPTAQPHAALSDREFQVMRMLAEGQSPTEIADVLNLSVKTVSTYRARVLTKMDMKSNAELARYALEHQLIS